MAKKEKAKDNKIRIELLWRILALIVCGILFYFWNILIAIVFLINLIITLIQNKPNENLKEFANIWLTELTRALKYLLFLSDQRPFPFAELESSKESPKKQK